MTLRKRTKRLSLLSARGQAMIEYSLVSHLMLGIGATTMLFFYVRLMDAINTFFDSIYFVLQSSLV
jgi:Flp pilus assembly pilin Flp